VPLVPLDLLEVLVTLERLDQLELLVHLELLEQLVLPAHQAHLVLALLALVFRESQELLAVLDLPESMVELEWLVLPDQSD